MKKQTNKSKPIKKVKTSSVKKAVSKRVKKLTAKQEIAIQKGISKAVDDLVTNAETHSKKMKTLKNDSPKDETLEVVPHVVINKAETEGISDEQVQKEVELSAETPDNSTVELDHDFLVNNELTGVYDGLNTITKEDGSKHKTVPGLVPFAAAGAKEGMLLQIIYTGKDVHGNFKFVVNELEDGDPGYFKN
jgi:hypothetical protein